MGSYARAGSASGQENESPETALVGIVKVLQGANGGNGFGGYFRDPTLITIRGITMCQNIPDMMSALAGLSGIENLMGIDIRGNSSNIPCVPVTVLIRFFECFEMGKDYQLSRISLSRVKWTGNADEFRTLADTMGACRKIEDFECEIYSDDRTDLSVWRHPVRLLLKMPLMRDLSFFCRGRYVLPRYLVCGRQSMEILYALQDQMGLHNIDLASLFILNLTHCQWPNSRTKQLLISQLSLSVMMTDESFGNLFRLLDFRSGHVPGHNNERIHRCRYPQMLALHVVSPFPVATSQWLSRAVRDANAPVVSVDFVTCYLGDTEAQTLACDSTRRSPVANVVAEMVAQHWSDLVSCDPGILKCTVRLANQNWTLESMLDIPEVKFLTEWNSRGRSFFCPPLFDPLTVNSDVWYTMVRRCMTGCETNACLYWFLRRYLPSYGALQMIGCVGSPCQAPQILSSETGATVFPPNNIMTACPVYYRSYSRRNEETGEYETWEEMSDRALRGLKVLGRLSEEELALVKQQFTALTAFPSGRWLWVGGTEWLDKPENIPGAYNCCSVSFTNEDKDWHLFGLTMDLCMQGCGTGVVLEEISGLPCIRNRLTVRIVNKGTGHSEQCRSEKTELKEANEKKYRMTVGDSRRGWVESYLMLLNLSSSVFSQHTDGEDDRGPNTIEVTIDLSNIRPAGRVLGGFGGTTNPVRLPKLYYNCAIILNGAIGRRINTLEACLLLDEACYCAAAGNIRRAAGMRQFSSHDVNGSTAKENLYRFDGTKWSVDPQREALAVANHTRVFHNKPTYEECLESVQKQYKTGEGALQWCGEAERRAGRGHYGLNPCGEIIGRNFLCNLAEVHLHRIDPLDERQQQQSFRAAALMAAVLLHHKFPDERLQASRERDPIIAVSFTGLFDFFVAAFGVPWLEWWQHGRPETPTGKDFKRKEIAYLVKWREVVETTVHSYCEKHNMITPTRYTAVQPAGTKSLLTGGSPGWHPEKAQRYIRRVMFPRNNPVALACLDCGYRIAASQINNGDANGNVISDPFDPMCTEWLIEIPVQVPWANLPGADAIMIERFSAVAQFDFYMQVQKYYSTHNTSATIELYEREIEQLAKRMFEAIRNDEGYISVALLARFDATDRRYPCLPIEPIDERTYKDRTGEIRRRLTAEDGTNCFARILSKYSHLSGGETSGPGPCDSDKCMAPLHQPEP